MVQYRALQIKLDHLLYQHVSQGDRVGLDLHANRHKKAHTVG